MAKTKGTRLFTFGCSLTRYHWPTWADILGQSFEEFYNWGNRGAGNRQILERFSEAVAKNAFLPDDVIIIQWTDYHRFDYHMWNPEAHETWYPGGGLFSNTEQDPTKGLVISKLWNEQSYQMHSLNFIQAGVALARTTRCRVYMTFAHDLRPDFNTGEFQGYKKMMQNSFWLPGDMYSWLIVNHDKRLSFQGADMGNLSDEPQIDHHPTPIMYYHWLKERISTRLNLQIDKDFATKMQHALENTKIYNDIGESILNAGYDTNKHYVRGY